MRANDLVGVEHDGLTPGEPPWPGPMSGEAFVGLPGELVETLAPHTEADPVAVLVQFLVAVGNLIGRGPHFRVESDTHCLNSNVVLVGRTAKGRKGTSWGHVRRLLSLVEEHWEQHCIASGLSSGEGLIWSVRDAVEQQQAVREGGRVVRHDAVQTDAGVPDKRLLVVESEFSSPLKVMSREGNTLSAIIRQAWDGENLRTLTKNNSAVATAPHISIIGHVTREELRRYLTETDMANGFANRFLWVCSRRSKMLPEGGAVEDEALFDLAERLVGAVNAARRINRMCRDERASELWRDVYPALSEGGAGLLGAVTSRSEAHVMRLACLYAALSSTAVIGVEHLRAALAVWRYCETSCRHVFGDSVGSSVADAILRGLRERYPSGMARTEIRDLFHRHGKREQIDGALAELRRLGRAYPTVETTGGRNAERWFAGSDPGGSVANVASVAAWEPSGQRPGGSDICDPGDESSQGLGGAMS